MVRVAREVSRRAPRLKLRERSAGLTPAIVKSSALGMRDLICAVIEARVAVEIV